MSTESPTSSMSPPPAAASLRLAVGDLLRRPGTRRSVELAEAVTGLRSATAAVPEDAPVRCVLTLEHVGDGIVVRGVLSARWGAECSRCLRPVAGELTVHVDELYETHPVEGETYPLEGEILDLEPLVRDALLLELPPAPLCGPDCRGLCGVCGADRNQTECDCSGDEPDPRWEALRSLDLQDR